MRFLEVEISEIRGIQYLKLEPNGKNFLISGPNGTGKSSVIDALDFLLTGDIRRLSGTGTRGVTVKKYGTHMDNTDPQDAYVSAVVKLGDQTEVKITRTIETPENLLLSDETQRESLQKALSLAVEGQHILTRREILRYIATEPNKRAQRIQALLNLSHVEDIRKLLVKVRNKFKQDYQSDEKVLSTQRSEIASLLQVADFDEIALLRFINDQRQILGSDAIDSLNVKTMRVNISYDDNRRAHVSNTASVTSDLQNVRGFWDQYGEEIKEMQEQLEELIGNLKKPDIHHALKHIELTEMGLSLLDETGKCPLCDYEWEPDQLKNKLEAKLDLAEIARTSKKRLDEISKRLIYLINILYASLNRLQVIANQISFPQVSELTTWKENIEAIRSILDDPLNSYTSQINDMNTYLKSDGLSASLDSLETSVEATSKQLSPEQLAYDMLVKLDQTISAWKAAEGSFETTRRSYMRSESLLNGFIESRDFVLNSLYNEIQERFETIYSQLHFEDENNFKANLQPSDTGLNLEVEFYDRGLHSPLALHSEGHQDSMGLCLFLALAEKISRNHMSLIILDDVVMSVDAEHRKRLCKVLSELFTDFQIIIATHDKTWHHQLRSEGVVNRKGTLEFLDWHIASGPRISNAVDVWEKIAEDLDKNDVPSAAHKLRRWGEIYFAEACERLGAKVLFKQDAKWDLGHLFHPAIGTWKDLIKKAKNAANSWNQTDKVMELTEIDDAFKAALKRTQTEQWVINPLVHHTPWLSLSKQEFQDVVVAFKDLVTFFECETCGSMLFSDNTITPKTVKCSCSSTLWNLEAKR